MEIINNFLENVFAALESDDSVGFLFFTFLAFLLGFIIAWIGWGGRARKLKKELKNLEADLLNLQTENETLKEQLDLKEADLIKAEREAEEAVISAKRIESEKEELDTQILTLTDLTEKLKLTNRSYAGNIEDLNHQILGLKTQNNQLSDENKKEGEALDQLMQMQSSYNATVKRLAAVEEKLNLISSENDTLKDELASVKTSTENLAAIASQPQVVEEETEEKTEANEDTDAAKKAVQEALGSKIEAGSADDKDDLTLIKGIGSFIEDKLNALGIYSYKQISQFDEDLIEKVTTAIAFFPGRIKRDDWVGQATRLMEIKDDNPDALNPSAVFPTNKEDLKIVEGIGPKIEQLLKNSNINTWSDLAGANVDKLKTILAEGGDRFRIHDPSTWPMQAQMAADGKWEELKEYQDFLIGGKVKK